MATLGEYLRSARENAGYSQKQVKEKTGITDSRLSRIERGVVTCPPAELKTLADLYHASIVDIFIMAGYLTKDDLDCYQEVFHGVSELDADEREHIQQSINLLTKRRDQG